MVVIHKLYRREILGLSDELEVALSAAYYAELAERVAEHAQYRRRCVDMEERSLQRLGVEKRNKACKYSRYHVQSRNAVAVGAAAENALYAVHDDGVGEAHRDYREYGICKYERRGVYRAVKNRRQRQREVVRHGDEKAEKRREKQHRRTHREV